MLETMYIYNRLPDEVQHYLRFYQYKFFKTNEFAKFQEMRFSETSEGYSLKSFDEYKCIFVHIPKCAGISLTRSLFGNLAGGQIDSQNGTGIALGHVASRSLALVWEVLTFSRIVNAGRSWCCRAGSYCRTCHGWRPWCVRPWNVCPV